MVLEQNSFIEFNLPRTILRSLTEEEMNSYRRPFAEPGEGRRTMLSWARQLPIDGAPADVTKIVTAFGAWLSQSPIPKLYVKCDPGTTDPRRIEFCRTWPEQTEVIVRGHHTPQEDSPYEIGRAIASWMHTFPSQMVPASGREEAA